MRVPARWMGWRLRGLVAVALAACLVIFSLTRWLVTSPSIDPADAAAAVLLADGQRISLDAALLRPSPRWQVSDARRTRQIEQQRQLARALAQGSATLLRADGTPMPARVEARGWAGLGLMFWSLAALALLMTMVGAVVLLARPHLVNMLYLTMALCQAANLLFLAATSVRGFGLPVELAQLDMPVRMALDIITAAAVVHAFALHPRRLRAARGVATAAWGAAALLLALAWAGRLGGLWWWAQGAAITFGFAALAVVSLSYRVTPNPLAAVLRRFGAVSVATLALVTAAVAAAAWKPAVPQAIAEAGIIFWTLFFASLLLLTPFVSGSRQVMREFALIAGISTVAASLDLLFVAVFSLGPFTSLTLVVFLALGLYTGARQWILNQIVGSNVLTTERIFEQLYRAAREVQAHPDRYGAQLALLLRDLFEPLEVLPADKAPARSRVLGGGSALLVPVLMPALMPTPMPMTLPPPAVTTSPLPAPSSEPITDTRHARPSALVLRFARRGQRIFTREDARLADRVVEQLRRAVAYDLAVERGRNEERLRIAQDLHDDIGARLLTLMYQAPTPEMEDYVRHTLKDLKTLTRGLAAAEHRLSHAVAEWKADIAQRLAAARIELDWSAQYDRDGLLSMVQWSALTRVLRELVSNTIHHGHASHVAVALALQGSRLRLSVADNGDGAGPQDWSHGLGLGGVRKRVRLLGGEVAWRENAPRGIVCEVQVAEFALRP